MSTTTSRLGLTELASDGSDPVAIYRTAINNNASKLDIAVVFASGTLADQPSPGLISRLYFATDNSHLYYDTGSAWLDLTSAIAAGSVTAVMLATGAAATNIGAAGVTAAMLAVGAAAGNLAAGSVTATMLASGSVTAAKIAAGAAASNIGTGGVTAAMLAAGAAASNIGALGVTAAMLAAGAAASNLGSPSGDLTGSWPGPTVVKLQGNALSAAQASKLSVMEGIALRGNGATAVAAGEVTYFEGTVATAFTLPTSPVLNTRNRLVNAGTVNCTYVPGGLNTLAVFGATPSSIIVRPGESVEVEYVSGAWYQIGGILDTDWAAVGSFAGSWGGSVSYRRKGSDLLLRGQLTTLGTTGTTAFTLPSGFQPAFQDFFGTGGFASGTSLAGPAYVTITTEGAVQPSYGSGVTGGVFLGNLRIPLD